MSKLLLDFLEKQLESDCNASCDQALATYWDYYVTGPLEGLFWTALSSGGGFVLAKSWATLLVQDEKCAEMCGTPWPHPIPCPRGAALARPSKRQGHVSTTLFWV